VSTVGRASRSVNATVPLVRDCGSQFIDAFDEVFEAEGLKILKTPVRTPVANTFAERWIGSELLDRTIIWNRRQLERLVVDYIEHHNTHRPHCSLEQQPPSPQHRANAESRVPRHVIRSTRCDGLVNEYRPAA
jgi:transposase InsO family protein